MEFYELAMYATKSHLARKAEENSRTGSLCLLTRASIAIRPLHAGVLRYHHRIQINVRIEFQHVQRFHGPYAHQLFPQRSNPSSIYGENFAKRPPRRAEGNGADVECKSGPRWRLGFTAVSTFIDCLCDTRYRGL